MIISTGKDDFVNNTFDKYRWSANTYETPEEINSRLRELGVFDKTVKGISAIGAMTESVGSWKERAVNVLRKAGIITRYKVDRLPTKRTITLNDGSVHDLDDCLELLRNVSTEREVRLREPLLIFFEDGDVLELLPRAPKGLRIGLNTLPRDMRDGLNRCEFDVGMLFNEFVSGGKFSRVEIRSSVMTTTYSYNRDERTRKRNLYCIYFSSRSNDGWLHLEESQSSEYDLSFSRAETIKCGELEKLAAPSYQTCILEGRHGGGAINIFPVKGIGWEEAPYETENPENFAVFYKEPALYWPLLEKYFDPELPVNKECSQGYYHPYYWNCYTKDTVIKIVEEVGVELQRIRSLPPEEQEEALQSKCRNQTDEEMLIQIKEAISFTERFSARLLGMALNTPEYNYIVFMGP